MPIGYPSQEKEQENVEKCQDLKREIGKLLKCRKVTVVPVVIGALGIIGNDFKSWERKSYSELI